MGPLLSQGTGESRSPRRGACHVIGIYVHTCDTCGKGNLARFLQAPQDMRRARVLKSTRYSGSTRRFVPCLSYPVLSHPIPSDPFLPCPLSPSTTSYLGSSDKLSNILVQSTGSRARGSTALAQSSRFVHPAYALYLAVPTYMRHTEYPSSPATKAVVNENE